jgi:hypothetical protein
MIKNYSTLAEKFAQIVDVSKPSGCQRVLYSSHLEKSVIQLVEKVHSL